MRYLKSKVNRSLQNAHYRSDTPSSLSDLYSLNEEITKFAPFKQGSNEKTKGLQEPKDQKKEYQSNKNVLKNYARAMMNFALSNLATSYLEEINKEENIDIKDFRAYIIEQKEAITSIKNLRGLLLVNQEDSTEEAAFKRLFQKVSMIFVKFFSVRWIYNSKIVEKLIHLKYRLRILRRLRNPEYFTHLEGFNKVR